MVDLAPQAGPSCGKQTIGAGIRMSPDREMVTLKWINYPSGTTFGQVL